MLIGPLLLFLTLLVSLPNFYDPFLPSVTALGLLCVWKWRLNGFLLTLLTFSLYFCFHFFFGAHGIALWKFGWGCSFGLALTVSFLVMEDVKKHYASLKQAGDQTASDLKLSLRVLEEKAASEKRQVELELEELGKKLDQSHQKNTQLLQLVEASRVEAEKTYQNNETLSAESLEQHRKFESLKLQADESIEELDILQEQHARLLSDHRFRLKKLNQVRTEYAQMQELFEASQKDFQKFRSVILNQRQQLSPKPEEKGNRAQSLILKTLEKDKKTIKKMYEQIQLDHEKLTEMLKHAKVNEEEHVHTLENQVLENKKKLEKTKSELVALEREIFVVKKGMQQEGVKVT